MNQFQKNFNTWTYRRFQKKLGLESYGTVFSAYSANLHFVDNLCVDDSIFSNNHVTDSNFSLL